MTLKDLASRWAELDLEPATPVTDADLAAFEAKHGVTLPPDVRAYFCTLNGMASGRSGGMDSQMLTFWRFDELEPGASLDDGRRLFCFADFLIDSHRYAMALNQSPGPAPVFIDDVTQFIRIANSFEAFLELYLNDDEDALAGGRPVEPAH